MAKKAKDDGSLYKVIELVGTSSVSWADAAKNAVKSASKTLRDVRVAEVSKLDVKIGKDGAMTFRAKMKLSYKYQGGHPGNRRTSKSFRASGKMARSDDGLSRRQSCSKNSATRPTTISARSGRRQSTSSISFIDRSQVSWRLAN